tara:strand:+ start:294 stop:446 length:153 start_codon:yes stop_codon:yes gene_type:complete
MNVTPQIPTRIIIKIIVKVDLKKYPNKRALVSSINITGMTMKDIRVIWNC